MTKNQRKQFLRLWIGANLFHLDFGFDETTSTVDVTEKDVDFLYEEKTKVADKYLKNNNAYSSTKDIYDFVIENYK